MPDVIYKSKTITVRNEETTEGDQVTKISAMGLFVSSPAELGRRYAFDIEELEKYIVNNDSLINFYLRPKATFSTEDIHELQQRSPIIRAYIKSYLEKNQGFMEVISPETLKQMRQFVDRTTVMTKDGDFLRTVKEKYSASELDELEQANVSIYDLGRGEAFKQFKSYYSALADEEKSAIDNFPGIPKALKLVGLVGSNQTPTLNSIFTLKAESCLGGTAGVCEKIIGAVEFAHQLKDIMKKEHEVNISFRVTPVTTEVSYKGQRVPVANTQTINGVSIDRIAPELLFVSEPDTIGKRYAFDIEELEEHLVNSDCFINFYAKPRSNFSANDIIELQQRSPKIRAFMENYLERHRLSLDTINPETLEQMRLFLRRTTYLVMDEDFLKEVASEYTPSELSDLKEAGLSLHDLARGRAFEQFKTYYDQLSKDEKRAIDTLPGIQGQFELFHLVDSKEVAGLSNIFSLTTEDSLGGSAGICEKIITAVTFLKQLKEIPEEARGFKIAKELQMALLKEVDNYIASNSNTNSQYGLGWITTYFSNPELAAEEWNLALKAKKEIKECTNYHSLVEKIKSFKEEDAKLEQKHKTSYGLSKGYFLPYLERMESILASAKGNLCKPEFVVTL